MDLRADLKTLLSFSLELQETPLDHLISCATNLLLLCPSARPSVLSVYGQLLADLTLVYVQQESASSDIKSPSISFGKWIPLFKTRTQTRKTVHSVSVIKRLSSNCSSDEKETPSSPPASATDEKEDMMMATDGDEDEDREETVKTVMDRLSVSLLDLTRKESSLEQEITFWAIERLGFISGIISPEAGQDMKEMTAYLTQCPVTCLLMQILNNSLSLKRLDLKDVLLKLREETDVSHDRIEWIVCCLMSALMSSGHDISSCMQLLLESSSMPDSLVCSVLSFLSSSLNPVLIRSLIQAAISNCSKRNSLSFLLRICCKSKALLDVFSNEVTDRKLSLESLSFLDSLTSSKQLDSEAKKHLIECLLLADKFFSLLLLVMDVSVDTRASNRLRREALSVLQAIVLETQDLSYSRSKRNDQFMQDLKQNYRQLVSHPLFKARKLQEIMKRLMVSLCVFHGFHFSVQVIHCLLNEVQGNDSTDFTVHPSLMSLLSSLSLFYGAEMKQLPNRLLCLQETKNNEFWNNFYALSVMNEEHGLGNRCRFHVAWELESITEHLVRHLHLEMKLNTRRSNNLDSILIILRMILHCLNQKETQRLEYSLCVSLVIHYIRLTEKLEEVLDRNSGEQETDRDKKYTEQLMTALSTNEEIMRSLTSHNQSQCHQQILCKTFLDCLLWHPQEVRGLEDHLSLTQQNDNESQTGQRHCLKLRKALMRDEESNAWNKKRNHRLFSRQLIVSAVSSCIQDMTLFSKVLLEAVTPASSSFPLKDVLQSIWPEQDFVKVTIERDLLISKEFERNPVLWDLVHVMVSEAQSSLNDSLLLFQALMAVQLTEWTKWRTIESLDTLAPQNNCLEATQRLLALLFQSHFMPLELQAITSVLPSFSSFEVFCVLNDIWSFIHDQNQLRNSSKISPYLHRLRVILSNRDPGPFFVTIFKPILQPILS